MPPQSADRPDAGAQIEQERLGRANLIFFLNDRLRPVVEQIEAIDSFSNGRAHFLQAELLESFSWLHLGVQIGYFPLPLARRAMYEYFPAFLKAYDSVSSRASFQAWFTSPIRTIWESEFTGRQELFSSGRIFEETAPSETVTSFHSALILANGFAQNAEARPLVQAITVSKDAEWEEAVRDNRAIAGLETSEAPEGTHWAYSGYFTEVDYMQANRLINMGVRQTHEKTTHEFEDYLRRVREIQQWRLNFVEITYRDRFTQIGHKAAEAFVQHLSAEERRDSESVVKKFLAEVYDLMTDWGAPRAMVAGGGASHS